MGQLHAFIIGIENYPHLVGGDGAPAGETFGLKQLSSPYPSAIKVAETLVTNYRHPERHLGSIRLCLSPIGKRSAQLTPILKDRVTGHIRGGTAKEVRDTFDEWFTACDSSEDNLAFFYFCGHGIRRTDRLLLLRDFGSHASRPFEACINFDEILEGMRGVKARTQCFLVDACQEAPFAMGQYRTHPKVIPWVDSISSWRRPIPSEMPSVLQVFSSQPGGLSRAPLDGLATVANDFKSFLIARQKASKEVSLGALAIELSNRQLQRHMEMGDFPAGEVRLEGRPGKSFCQTVSQDKIEHGAPVIHQAILPCNILEVLGLQSYARQGHLTINADTGGFQIDSDPAMYVGEPVRRQKHWIAKLEDMKDMTYIFGTGVFPRLEFLDTSDAQTLRLQFSKNSDENVPFSVEIK